MNWIQSITLEDPLKRLRLEPLDSSHAAGLAAAGSADDLHRNPWTWIPSNVDIREYLSKALQQREASQRWPWVVRLADGEIVGTTSFHDVIEPVKRVEIGYTWYAKVWQRSYVNSVCKALLMRYAFDALKANVVAWRCDALNLASQAAILRLGAKHDGTLRGHAPRRDGSIRDSMLFSMTASEWHDEHRTRILTLAGIPD